LRRVDAAANEPASSSVPSLEDEGEASESAEVRTVVTRVCSRPWKEQLGPVLRATGGRAGTPTAETAWASIAAHVREPRGGGCRVV